jgi:peptidoglycan biosynthesis protein MviN/MurJ (putative lipid II flippase)
MIFVTPLYLSLIGRHDLPFIFRTQAVLALVNVLVSSAAIPLLGLIGAAFGLLVATILNAATIYVRCRIEAEVFSDSEVPMSRAKRRMAIAIALLAATIAWATAGGGQPLVLLAILAGLGAIMAGEPLVGRMIDQFVPGRT